MLDEAVWYRREFPDLFLVWAEGRVRPYWFTQLRKRAGVSLDALAEELAPMAEWVERGVAYPSWTFLFRYAHAVSGTVDDLLFPAGDVVPVIDESSSETALWFWLAVRYHPAVVRNTMIHLNRDYQLPIDDAFVTAMAPLFRTIARSTGTLRVAGVTPAEVIADLDAGRAPETRILRARWKRELAPFHTLISTGSIDDPTLFLEGTPMHGFDAVCWMNSSAGLSIVGSIDPEIPGRVSISFAAHHEAHGRIPLPDGELDLWLPALFTPEQLPHLIRRGTASGIQTPNEPIPVLTTEYITYQT